ncbi:MAG: SAM-dependent methyltransferase [Bacteroidota bacterium]
MHIQLTPIAYVKNARTQIEDDDWSTVSSEIILADEIISEALIGIEAFSHLQIIFYMDQVTDAKAIAQFRHPRNNSDLPKLGTYAQRNKNRPNKLGLTTVELIEKQERSLIVNKLDAIDGTPILDIKPVMRIFQPQGEIREPDWLVDLLKNYWIK